MNDAKCGPFSTPFHRSEPSEAPVSLEILDA